ncbi:MAG: heme exporter protein CcmB, partial [bacterium]
MLTMFRWIVVRDLTLAWRRRADVLSTLFFFVIVVSLFPLGIGPESQLLRSIAPGVVWVAALLASMLSLSRIFENDYHDGTLEQMLMTPQPLFLVVLGLVLIQFVPHRVDNPAAPDELKWDRLETRQLVMRSCGDCHSID